MDNTQNTPTNKHLFALTAILFFAPAVPFVLKNNDYWLTKEDNDFVKWYIKYWFIILWVFILWIVSYTISYIYWKSISNIMKFDISSLIWNVLTWWGIIMIIVWIFMIFADKPIFSKWININLWKVKSWNFSLISNYIPLYNIYLWYSGKRDIKRYWWLKESTFFLFIWILLWSISIKNPVFITFIFIVFLLVRIWTLLWWIDFIKDHIKEKIDKLFNNNPEEILSYFTWFIKFIAGKLIKNKKSLIEYIERDKKMYSQIIEIENNETQIDFVIFYIQYGLLILLSFSYLIYINSEIRIKISWLFYVVPYLFLITRYWIVIYCKKIIPIPILHEISIKIKNLINIIK